MKTNKTKETYEKALEVVQQVYQNPSSLDIVAFLLKLAQEHPNVLVSTTNTLITSLKLRVIQLLREGRKVQAIKLYRAETRKCLKEAAEEVNKIAKEQGIPIHKRT
jgi:uncharacterized protein YihD (DUF1040 family)